MHIGYCKHVKWYITVFESVNRRLLSRIMQRIVENNVFLNYVLALKRHQNYHARKVPRNFAIKKKKKKLNSHYNRLQITPVNILFYADKVYSQINLFGFKLQFTFLNCIIWYYSTFWPISLFIENSDRFAQSINSKFLVKYFRVS